jgi:hypothetical protein
VGTATGDGSGHGTASTKDKEETGENVQEGELLLLHPTGVLQRAGDARSGLPGWR